jgi:hypothetical protein
MPERRVAELVRPTSFLIIRDQNAQGMNGRENMLSAFDQSTEFAAPLNSLEAAAPPAPTCDPVQVLPQKP